MTNKNSRDGLNEQREKKIDTHFGSNTLTRWDDVIVKTLLSGYPDLSRLELAVCMWTFYTMWDLNSGNSAMYIEVIARLLRTNTFSNENEIEHVLKNLVSKSILEDTQELWIIGGKEVNLKVLKFGQERLCMELGRSLSVFLFG